MDYLGEQNLESYVGTPYEGFGAKKWALTFIETYGQIDGAHHKTWVLDQVARILCGTPVKLSLARWSNGQEEYRFNTGEPSKKYLKWSKKMLGECNTDGEHEYGYDTGIAP